MTRTPTPSTAATDSDSTSPSKTRTSVSLLRATYASTCSPSRAAPATRRASASRSGDSVTRSPTDGELGHPQSRLPGGNRHPLAELAAGAGPGPEVVADRIHEPQGLRAVADQVRSPQRFGDLAVLDEVGLGHPEHVVAGGRVDLATTELGAVDAVRRVAHDVRGVVLALEEIGVGHPYHRQIGRAH